MRSPLAEIIREARRVLENVCWWGTKLRQCRVMTREIVIMSRRSRSAQAMQVGGKANAAVVGMSCRGTQGPSCRRE